MKFTNFQLFQEIKGYSQISEKFNVPKDIMEEIIKMVYLRDIPFENECRLFYKNIILFNIMGYKCMPTLSLTASLLEDKLQEKDKNMFRSFNSLKEDIFKHRFPDGRGVEWAIQSYSSDITEYPDPRTVDRINTNICIEILGESNYLVILKADNCTVSGSDHKRKLKYLKNTDFKDIEYDYFNYLDYKGTEDEDAWRIFLNSKGEGTFLPVIDCQQPAAMPKGGKPPGAWSDDAGEIPEGWEVGDMGDGNKYYFHIDDPATIHWDGPPWEAEAAGYR